MPKYMVDWKGVVHNKTTEFDTQNLPKDWGTPLGTCRAILSYAYKGAFGLLDIRASDVVTITGDEGIWEGKMMGYHFKIWDLNVCLPPVTTPSGYTIQWNEISVATPFIIGNV